MKKYQKLSIIIVLVILLTLSSCNKTNDIDKNGEVNGKVIEPASNIVNDEPSLDNSEKEPIINYSSEDNIDEDNLLSLVEELISEKYMGRSAGTQENELAKQYIVDKFKEIGLEVPQGTDNYLQDFNLNCLTYDEVPIMQLEDKDGNVIKSFKYTDDFVIRLHSTSKNIDIKAPLHLVKGSESESNVNADALNKILLLPITRKANDNLYIKASGSLAGIIEDDITSARRNYSNLPVAPLGHNMFDNQYQPNLRVDRDTFEELKDAAKEDLILHIKHNFTVERDKKISNVIGVIPGSDPVLKDEYIIIGAHFDHVGDNKNGTYNPGALDNASGTSALLEIARIIKSNETPPKKTIIFAAFNGEENGLVGSYYYVENPLYPLDKAVMINLDMIGCSADIPLSISTSKGEKNELQKQLIKYAKDLNIKYKTTISAGSDHAPFSSKGVEAVLLINEDFLNGYHSYNDTIEDVDKFNMEQVVKLVLYYIDNSFNSVNLKE